MIADFSLLMVHDLLVSHLPMRGECQSAFIHFAKQ